MKLTVVSTIGQNSTLTVSDSVFGAKISTTMIAQAVRVYLANQRQGSSKTQTRSEVSRTKKKWFKQKGTGNARHGARTPSLFVGGGVAHGPTGHENWSLKLSASQRKSALSSALSAQVAHIVVSDDINQLDGKTVSAQKMLTKMMPEAKHILVVLPKADARVVRSLRNLESGRKKPTHDQVDTPSTANQHRRTGRNKRTETQHRATSFWTRTRAGKSKSRKRRRACEREGTSERKGSCYRKAKSCKNS